MANVAKPWCAVERPSSLIGNLTSQFATIFWTCDWENTSNRTNINSNESMNTHCELLKLEIERPFSGLFDDHDKLLNGSMCVLDAGKGLTHASCRPCKGVAHLLAPVQTIFPLPKTSAQALGSRVRTIIAENLCLMCERTSIVKIWTGHEHEDCTRRSAFSEQGVGGQASRLTS